IFVGTVAVVVGLTTPLLFGFVDAYQVIAVAASVFWIMGRMVDSVSLPFFYYKKFIGEFNIVKHTLAPIVITAINAVGLGLTLLPPVYLQTFQSSWSPQSSYCGTAFTFLLKEATLT
ncbi:MAG: hypothetical protein QW688_09130, partial [Thermoprotei archaeon]